ncbi:MAG TPA: hypothetical protein VL326_17810 [Kofleriaceae bacterium]|nr:hypothetical protein [Kofleriaceae bacterium]
MKLVILVLVLATTTVAAQPSTLQPTVQPTPTVEQTPTRSHRSPGLAKLMSIGLTTAGFTTVLITNSLATPDDSGRRLTPKYKLPLYLTGGILLAVGPTSGHLYAGEYWNNALTVRLISGGIMVLAAGAIDNVSSETDHNGNGGAIAVTVIAGVVFLGASAYEAGTAGRAAERYNARHAGPAVTVVPVISREPGIALVGQF